jgi:hypothetical protein
MCNIAKYINCGLNSDIVSELHSYINSKFFSLEEDIIKDIKKYLTKLLTHWEQSGYLNITTNKWLS